MLTRAKQCPDTKMSIFEWIAGLLSSCGTRQYTYNRAGFLGSSLGTKRKANRPILRKLETAMPLCLSNDRPKPAAIPSSDLVPDCPAPFTQTCRQASTVRCKNRLGATIPKPIEGGFPDFASIKRSSLEVTNRSAPA